MNKILCIYPKDATTEFLRPVYNDICALPNVKGLELDTINDDDFLDHLSSALLGSNIVIFLGHGSSTCLYGTNLNPLVDDGMGNIEELRGKSMIIFACKSAEFIKRYHFPKSLGFGFIPTSLDDARDGVLHNMNLRELDSVGLEMFKKAIVRIWHRTLKEVTFEQMERIPDLFSFYTNHEIVNTLLHHKDYQYYRIVADMLYYLKDDMRFIF